MIKIIDIDELFDKYISDFVYKNIGKVNPEEIENQMPILYGKFGKESLKELDGKAPETYYKEFSGEQLLSALKTHLEQGVEVSDFLCEAITELDTEQDLLDSLFNQENEEFIMYVMNILVDKKSTKCLNKFLQLITLDYSENICELATEFLKENANFVKEEVLVCYEEGSEKQREYFVEILSNVKDDDRVFEILMKEFTLHQDNLPLYASYLSRYGDSRALPFLLTAIENDKLNYQDFKELQFAIESLGGSYEKKRDFSSDKIYKKIKGQKQEN